MPAKINANQLDLVAADLEAAGTDTRQLSIKAGGITEAKLGFSWEVVEIAAASFSFDGTRSNYTLSTAASSNSNVTDQAALLENGVDNKTLVATTAAENDFSLSGTALSIHGDITATGATYKLRYIVGTASGTASSSGNQFWLGTVPQQPEQTETDYFTTGTLDSKWEEFDPGSAVTVAEDSDGLVITAPADASKKFGGVIQPVPGASNYAITLMLSSQFLQSGGGDGLAAGVIWGENLAASGGDPANGNFYANLLSLGGTTTGGGNNFQQYSSYTTFLANYATSEWNHTVSGPVFLRLYVDTGSTQITALTSTDGRRWIARAAAQTYSLTPGSMGIVIHNNTTSGVEAKLFSRMFRVDETSDPYLPVGGYVGTSVPSTFFDRQDVIVTPNGTVNVYGWNDRKAKLISAQAFSVITATVGAYTMALTKDPGGTADNMLSTATFDMTTLTNGVPEDLTLTSTADDLILDANTVWQATFTSDNAGLDAEGVYFMLTWLVL